MSSTRTPSLRTRRITAAGLACALVALVLLVGSDAGRAERGGPGGDSSMQLAPGLAPADAAAKPGKGGKGKPKKPNIVVVVTDDQALSTVLPESMPHLFNQIRPRGTTFDRYSVTTPLCCPSRAGYMTGTYGHNNGVLRNHYPDLREKKNVLASWLQRAGYTTAHIGKFLNDYEKGKLGPAAVAPGWDKWFTELEKRRYYNWKASKNGKVVRFGNDDNDHVTSVTTDYAVRWAKQLSKKKDPFYLQVDYYAPHVSTGRDKRCGSAPVPEPRDERRFDDHSLPTPPSFNEADVSDKPQDIRERPQLTLDDRATIERRYRCTLESVFGVDRGMGKIFNALKRRKELNDTVFVYTSDNGYFYGEHRIVKGKPDPYDENLRMPLTIVVPPKYLGGADPVPVSSAPVANIDLAPTLMDLARGKPCRRRGVCRTFDGRSLMPILDGEGGFPNDRAIGIEIEGCQYRGVRQGDYVYIEHSDMENGECVRTDTELYDLSKDPWQLDNLFPAPPLSPTSNVIQRMHDLTVRLEDCSGIEGRDPAPASGHYCQ
jgi:arylsulfatase A-like enzyme